MASTAGGMGSIPGPGTNSHGAEGREKKNKFKWTGGRPDQIMLMVITTTLITYIVLYTYKKQFCT